MRIFLCIWVGGGRRGEEEGREAGRGGGGRGRGRAERERECTTYEMTKITNRVRNSP